MNRVHSDHAEAQDAKLFRLPTDVIPERYNIELKPDLESFTFCGFETITVQVLSPTRSITVNAQELDLLEAFVIDAEGTRLDASITMDEEHEFAHLSFQGVLGQRSWQLNLSFKGVLNENLKGFYRSFYNNERLGERAIATTQFESTDARRAFPCFDEPQLKATFKVSLIVPEEYTVLSNGEIVKEELVEESYRFRDVTALEIKEQSDKASDKGAKSEDNVKGRLKKVEFSETMKMSTYLVAFVVGDFVLAGKVSVNGKDILVWSTPGKEHLGKFALRCAAHALRWYEKKFRIKYPGGNKIDMVAMPDFDAGAMENTGCIIFRESDLLIDESTGTIAEMKRVADVVLHEFAHMWFGNLTTMRWWTWLWLNESFATLMSLLCLDALFPEWHVVDDFALSRAAALRVDSLKSTHPIETPVHLPEQAQELFDVISYQKGCACLFMLYRFMGEKLFFSGTSRYLTKFSYDNAEGHEYYDSLQEECDEKKADLAVRRLMDAWVLQSGHPIVEVSESKVPGCINLSQREFKFISNEASDQLWPVPIHLRSKTPGGQENQVVVLKERSQDVSIGENFEWVVANADGNGFFRVLYSSLLAEKLTADPQKNLGVVERFNLLNDTWSAVRAGLCQTIDYLKLLKLFSHEMDPNVWGIINGSLTSIHGLLKEDLHDAFAAFVQELATPSFRKLGWTSSDKEDVQTKELRGSIIKLLGTLGRDQSVRLKAEELFGQWTKDRTTVDTNVLPAIVSILAYHGDQSRYDEFFGLYQSLKGKNPQDEKRFLYSLTGFMEPVLYERATQLALSEQVRAQDAPSFIAMILNSTRQDKAKHGWEFVKSNWEAMIKRYSVSGMIRIAGAVTTLDTPELEADVKSFYATHPIESGTMAMDQALEQLRINVALRERDAQKLASHFAPSKEHAAANA